MIIRFKNCLDNPVVINFDYVQYYEIQEIAAEYGAFLGIQFKMRDGTEILCDTCHADIEKAFAGQREGFSRYLKVVSS